MTQLPAYLQNMQAVGLAARAADGIGSALPPHISIRGNQFTMVDAAGNKQTAQTTFLDVCIADISDVMCKMYFGDENGPIDWTPDSSEPPACWSANGVAPSIEAISPQSPRCDTCQWNRRGSDVAMDGKTQIKACRDEKWLAVLVPGVAMPLKVTLTPGSFKNWRAYVEQFRGKPIDMCHVFTRLAFAPDTNGVLTFTVSPTGYIDQATATMYGKMHETKASDVLVGRTDRPRQTMLAASAGQAGGAGQAPLLARPDLTGTSTMQAGQPAGFQPAPFGNAAPAAGATTAPAAGAPSTAQPEQAAAPRRRRRTAEQIAADNAAAALAAGGGAALTGGQAAPFAAAPAAGGQAAPFGAAATGTGGAPFGIAANAPPPPAGLDNALDALFAGGQS